MPPPASLLLILYPLVGLLAPAMFFSLGPTMRPMAPIYPVRAEGAKQIAARLGTAIPFFAFSTLIMGTLLWQAVFSLDLSSNWIVHEHSYLELRRSTGFRRGVQEYLLHNFASFTAERGETHIRSGTAIEWAAQAPSEGQRANRLGTLRVFARFARAEDAGHEVPPERVFCARRVHLSSFHLHR